MARYFDLTNTDIAEIAGIFGIKPTRWEHITGGAANTSYLLADENEGLQYVLTILNGRSMSPDKLIEILETVAAEGVPVAAPLRTKSGASHMLWREQRIIIKPFVKGECSTYFPLDLLADAGALLAHIHLIPPPLNLPVEGHQIFNHNKIEDIADTAPPEYMQWLRASITSTDHVETSTESG